MIAPDQHIDDLPPSRRAVQVPPQIIAWTVVILSFICFCGLSAAAARGLYWFAFDSPVSLTVRLVVSQGNVILQAPNGEKRGIYDSQLVDPQTMIIVNDNAQGVLEFLDSYSSQVITTVTLTAGSQLTLQEASRPRFEVSRHPFLITLNGASGQMLISATPGTRAFQMEINSSVGSAELTSDGTYTVYTDRAPNTNGTRLNVFNQGGEAWLQLPSSQRVKVWPNTIAYAVDGSSMVKANDSPYTLLASGLFADQSTLPTTTDVLPDGWQCSTGAVGNEPAGVWQRSAAFEHGALHLWRVGQNLSHGETSCLITPNGPDGLLDTGAYGSLRLHVRFKLIAHDLLTNNLPVQDVPVCGVQATECPIMLEIVSSADPTDPAQTSSWHHGFYAMSDARYKFICDTCRVAHERVNPDVWYFYDSGDLRQQLTDGGRYIKQISVYASGHEYDVAIGEVTLLGGP